MADLPKFEESLAELEKLVAELEGGDLGLEEALKKYEKGVRVSAQMQAALDSAQRKVEKLSQGGLEPLEAEAPAAAEGVGEVAAAAKRKKAPGRKAPQEDLF